MANNKIYIKRTSNSGATPNTTNVANGAYIAPGELAINMADKKLFTANTSGGLLELGSNLNSLAVNSIVANGSTGAAGQGLVTDGSIVYWADNSGFTGSQGTTGFTGSLGFTGSQGSIGFTGSQGIQGTTGFTGSQGIQGVTGFTGSQGDQGLQGFTGSKGDTGSIGFTGSQGNTGATGFTGSLGFTGSQGPIGFTGSKGAEVFTDLGDVPSSYTGANSYLLAVTADANGVGFTDEIFISEFTLTDQTPPANVSNDSVTLYVTSSGTTPNREVAFKIKNELGEEIIISSVLV
jgi:hypothetical protein